MPHKYHVRQLVRLSLHGGVQTRASETDIYEVTRLMPADGTGEFSYRVKSSGSHERAVRESEIRPRVSDS